MHLTRSLVRFAAVLGVFGFAAGRVGCGRSGDDVASLGQSVTPSDHASEASAQRLGAEKLAACLIAEDVPAELEDEEAGQGFVGFDETEPWTMCYSDGMCSGSEGQIMDEAARSAAVRARDDLAQQYIEESQANPPPGAMQVEYLIVGSRDYTEAFRKCMGESGYVRPVTYYDPADEIRQKQAAVDITNEWVRCARDNGLDQLADVPAAVADNFATRPFVLLPLSVNDDQLRAVLKVCPNYYQGAEAMGYGMINVKEPSIGVDVPGFGATSFTAALDMDEATSARGSEIMAILEEAKQAGYAQASQGTAPEQ
jgi:hypothetical protein